MNEEVGETELADGEIDPRAMVLRHASNLPGPTSQTPAQARNDAVSSLTMAAYAKASQLVLTPEERDKLMADFPDDAFRPGAGGKAQLLYIEHAYLRQRLHEVFGPGQWAVIPRSRWTEDFTTSKGTPAKRVYVEVMLVVRGCFVAEAIGDMDYFPGNAQTNFGDAVEGAKSAGLRRLAKELGIGLQAWRKGFSDEWWKRNRNGRPAHQEQQAPAAIPNQRPIALPKLEAAADQGTAALQECWSNLTKEGRQDCRHDLEALKLKAADVDRRRAQPAQPQPSPDNMDADPIPF